MGIFGEIKDATGCPAGLSAGIEQAVELTVIVTRLRQFLPLSYVLQLIHVKASGDETLVKTMTGRMGFLTGNATEVEVKIGGNITPDVGANKLKVMLNGSLIGLINLNQDTAECNVTAA